jgi:hypothetical protein
MKRFNCRACKDEEGKPKNFKICFLDDKKYKVGVFELDKIGQPKMAASGKNIEMEFVSDVNAEQFLDIIADLQDDHPARPPILDLILLYYKGVCPMSLVDDSYSQIMVWETFSQEYGGYPFGNGILQEQPNKLIDAYLSILYSRNEYYRIREEKTKQKMKAEDKKNSNAATTASLRR